MKSEKPPKQNDENNDKKFPMTWRGFSLILVIIGGFALLGLIVYKISKNKVRR